ncbi:hypothetical protein RD792_017352 [Penstemon davidsonii]|uniref:PDZ domain-containing protein n=1 Tax=Penstemon davidsonii TaxID=160366 RepID=A0ABR0CM64_9LAMI|nr:hypothetical protein RD792_017352 [Penstemon davidsonii]
MQNPDTASTSFTIRYLSQQGKFPEALSLYVQMHGSGLLPNTFAVSSALKASARILCKVGGVMIHGQVKKLGLCKVVFVQTALLDFYSKIGDMEVARNVFDEITERNVVSWNSILAGYVRCGDLAMAQNLFDEMPVRDVVSWNSMVFGYARGNDMEKACTLFREMPERNPASWNAMIAGYVECGKIEMARSFFDAMPRRNNVSYITMISAYSKYGNVESAIELFNEKGEKDLLLYNAMISSFAQNNRAKEALQLFDEMLQSNANIQPDGMTLTSAISACSQLGDLKFGKWIESYMSKSGIKMDDHLATSLIDLYTKCGHIDKAYDLFHSLQKRDLVAYTAMILGCGINGRAKDAIKLFEEMMNANIIPNQVTFTGILTAYNHVGLVKEGYNCFMSLQKHGLVPTVDHYAIVVDLLGRAGQLEDAYELIKSMHVQPHAGVWGALLLACSLHNNVELAEVAAKNCFELEADSSGYHSLLANIYASAGRWDDVKRLRGEIEVKEASVSVSTPFPLWDSLTRPWSNMQENNLCPEFIGLNNSQHGVLPLFFSINPGAVRESDTSKEAASDDGDSPKHSCNCLGRDTIANAAAKIGPAVVNLSVPKGFHGITVGKSIGSGTIIDEDGTILTCAHLWGDFHDFSSASKAKILKSELNKILKSELNEQSYQQVEVTLQDGRAFEGTVVNADLHSDIAIVRIKSKAPLPTAKLGTSSKLRPGDWVVAVGCPLTLQNTVTAGIVSCVDRKSSDLGLGGMQREYLQTDCAINQGNSGGPLINIDGEVVGVNTMGVHKAQGLSFAVPVDSVSKIIDHFKRNGRVIRPWIGLKMLDLSDMIVAQLKEKNPSFPDVRKGLLVPMVSPGSPADRAGFRPGDVVVEFGGRPVGSTKEVVEIMGDKVGKPLKVVVKRANNVTETLIVIPEEANPDM